MTSSCYKSHPRQTPGCLVRRQSFWPGSKAFSTGPRPVWNGKHPVTGPGVNGNGFLPGETGQNNTYRITGKSPAASKIRRAWFVQKPGKRLECSKIGYCNYEIWIVYWLKSTQKYYMKILWASALRTRNHHLLLVLWSCVTRVSVRWRKRADGPQSRSGKAGSAGSCIRLLHQICVQCFYVHFKGKGVLYGNLHQWTFTHF